jgi:hypothetical protein
MYAGSVHAYPVTLYLGTTPYLYFERDAYCHTIDEDAWDSNVCNSYLQSMLILNQLQSCCTRRDAMVQCRIPIFEYYSDIMIS